jgi:hypothetical protein
MKYMIETDDKELATHTVRKESYYHGLIDASIITPIVRENVLDLEQFVGTNFIFEFRDGTEYKGAGTLAEFGRDSPYPYMASGGTTWEHAELKIGQTYFHEGETGCPIPEGVEFSVRCMDGVGGSAQLVDYKPKNNRSELIWEHTDVCLKVVGYKILGLKEGWTYRTKEGE